MYVNIGERFNQAVDYLISAKMIKNQAALTNALQVSKGYLSQIMTGKREPSDSIVSKLVNLYPMLNTGWLLTGEGEMLKGATRSDEDLQGTRPSTAHCVPVLPLAAQAGKLSDYSEGITRNDCEYAVSPIAGADMIIPVLGESMAPEYGNGSRVIVKKINDQAFIEWGKVYVLDTVNGIVMKEIHKGDTETELVCHSLNPDPKYAEFSVKRSDIIGMYRVLMCMTLK